MSSLDILFLSKEDVDAVALGLDEAMGAIEMGLRAHGQKKVVMPSKDHLALDRSERHWNILKGYVEPIDVAGVKVIGDFEGNYRFGLPSEESCTNGGSPCWRSHPGFAIMKARIEPSL